VTYLREAKLWGNDDPLFPATRIALGPTRQFEPVGLERRHWSTAAPIRSIFRDAFARAGLPYFNPHSFRNTLAQLHLRGRAVPNRLNLSVPYWPPGRRGSRRLLPRHIKAAERCHRLGVPVRAPLTTRVAHQDKVTSCASYS
jgi:hypothetical protein